MTNGLLGKKLGMTQVYDDGGRLVPVTVIEAGPCRVAQIKTSKRDGYEAVQLAFGEVPERKLTKGQRGHLKAAQVPASPASSASCNGPTFTESLQATAMPRATHSP